MKQEFYFNTYREYIEIVEWDAWKWMGEGRWNNWEVNDKMAKTMRIHFSDMTHIVRL